MLRQDTDFKCVDRAGNPLPVCYGIGAANHALLQQLQRLLNRLSAPVHMNSLVVSEGFRPLAVDGLVGAATVAAIVPAMGVTFQLAGEMADVLMKFNDGTIPLAKENVAAYAPELVQAFEQTIARVEARMRELGIQPRPTSTVGAEPPRREPSSAGIALAVGLLAAVGVAGIARTLSRASRPR
jgi:lysozyme family protein